MVVWEEVKLSESLLVENVYHKLVLSGLRIRGHRYGWNIISI